jgi:PAS domain S-box-containing protein/diguanylate cyclase (GGDEF)-like protein
MVLAGLWILASDLVLELLADFAPLAAINQTTKGLAFVLVTTLLLYWLLRRHGFHGERREQRIATPPAWLPLLVFMLFSAALIATGVFLFHAQRAQIRGNAEAQLRAVGELRIEQISNWLSAARANARHFGRVSPHVKEFDAWLKAGGTDRELAERIISGQSQVGAFYGHANLTLFDRQGTPRISAKADPHMDEHRAEALRAMADGGTLLVDFHQHGVVGAPMLGIFAPMVVTEADGERTIGALFFSLPARQTLFASLSRWPTPSDSGETVLGRSEGDAFRILFASRQPEVVMKNILVPKGNPARIGDRVIKGESGIVRNAVDYHARPVLAYANRIPDTPWFLIAKLDQREVDAPIDSLARGAALVVALLLLTAGLATWLWWRAQINRQRAQLLGKELERRVLARHLDYLSRYANDAFLLLDMHGRLLDCNDRVSEMYGYTGDELIGQSINLLRAPDHRDRVDAIFEPLLKDGQAIYETVHQDKHGRRFPVESSARLIDEEGLQRIHVSVRDISERKQAEQALREREARYRAVIETSADGFWMIDLDGRLLEVNDAYCRMSGYSREELLGMHISDLDARESPEEMASHMARINASGSSLFETLHRAKDGTLWQVEVNAAISRDTDRVFAFLRDVYQRNRSEALLRTRLQLSELALAGGLDDLMTAALDAAERFTGSHIGFFHFVDADQQDITLQAWSSNTVERMCGIEARQQAKGRHYPLNEAGVWADAIRQRQPLIHNDYASLTDRQGLPEGHAPLTRELVVPILRGDKVVAVLGVGNKASDYLAEDVQVVEQIASMTMDIVARKRAEDELKQSSTRLIEAQRIALLGNWEFDVASGRVSWSEQVYNIMGLDPRQPPPSYAQHRKLFHPDDLPRFDQDVARALTEGAAFQHELRVLRPDGEQRYMWATGQAVRNAEGKVARLYGTIQDITDRKQVEASLEQATHFDPLTGLPNARSLFERMRGAIQGQASLALLVLNIDRFAQLNESLGRSRGDSVLVALARRWSAMLPDHGLLARLDADQFAVLLRAPGEEDESDHDDLMAIIAIATNLLHSMLEPIPLGDDQAAVALTISIGIALFPDDAREPEALLHAAEDALRSAKAERGNQLRFYDRRHAQRAIDWFDTEAALRIALEQGELFLDYQPQVDAVNGRVIAAEALLRWRRNGEVVPPNRFIDVVEATDLAEPVSRWVLNAACRQARDWLDRMHPLRVAVNIFSDHVTSGRLLDDVRKALADNGLPPELLELEVVESSLLKNPELAARTMREIKRLGVGLALDDFGTGYSSLGYLKHYPFDLLKIDQLFARNVTRDPEDAAIVRATIELAHNLGMRVLAEGVETDPQLRFMARYGCDQIQGFLTSRPVSPEVVETLVMQRRDLRPAGHTGEAAPPQLLIIEDEPIEAEMLALLLRDAGYGAQSVTNLEGALEVMGRQRIDLIISDYYLVESNGVEVLAHLRRLFPDVPRIMVSGADESEVVIRAVNRGGIWAFLPKPVEPEVLLASIRRLLENADHRKPDPR